MPAHRLWSASSRYSKPVQDAPIEYTYKTEIVPLITECLIKAIETRDNGRRYCQTPKAGAWRKGPCRSRTLRRRHERLLNTRPKPFAAKPLISPCARDGCLSITSRSRSDDGTDGMSLKENMGQMVYGMDVDRERHKDQQIAFLPEGSHDVLRRATTQLTGLRLAELKISTRVIWPAPPRLPTKSSPTPTATTPRPTTSSLA